MPGQAGNLPGCGLKLAKKVLIRDSGAKGAGVRRASLRGGGEGGATEKCSLPAAAEHDAVFGPLDDGDRLFQCRAGRVAQSRVAAKAGGGGNDLNWPKTTKMFRCWQMSTLGGSFEAKLPKLVQFPQWKAVTKLVDTQKKVLRTKMNFPKIKVPPKISFAMKFYCNFCPPKFVHPVTEKCLCYFLQGG